MLPGTRLYYEVKLGGRTVVRKRASRSFTSKWLEMLYAQLGLITMNPGPRATDNTTSQLNGQTNAQFNCVGAVNTSSQGILIGSGNTAVTPGDYKLETQRVHGTGANQLSHLVQTVLQVPTSDATTTTFKFQRIFTNNSGASIDINEIGIYVTSTYNGKFYLIARDVLPATQTVNNGQSLTATYTWSSVI